MAHAGFEDEARTRPLDAAIIGRMWERMRRHRRAILANLGLVALIVLLELVPPRVTKHIIDVNLVSRDRWGLAGSVGVLLVALVGLMFLWRVQIRRVVSIGERVVFDLREEIFGHLQELSLAYYDKTKAGRLIARGTSDVAAMRNTLVWALPRLAHIALILVGATAMMCWLNLRLFAVMIVVIPLLAVVNTWFRARVSVAWRRVREVQSRIVAEVAENINGMRVIQAYTREQQNLRDFEALQTESFGHHMRAARIVGVYIPSLHVIGAIGKAIILIYGGYLVWHGEAAIGTLVAFVMYHDMFFGPIHELGEIYNDALHAMAGGERIFSLLDVRAQVRNRRGARALPRIDGHVAFEHVTFAYNPGVPVLHDVCFEVEPGMTVALVGPTGGGKSTMVKLVARFYDVGQGRVRIDGHDVRDVTLESLHRQMGMVSQMNFLFSGTVRDNIRFARPSATEAEVYEAARMLGCHEDMLGLPDGYGTEVTERGQSLSIGQRQLVCLARAMLADPRIFILDEATSAIDTHTEMRIQRALRRLLTRRTSFVIAHRLSTVRHADLVLVVEDGRIIERGTHESLLRGRTRYRMLYEEFVRTS
jgi:ATP-binding cassette subfamily B multidrug efflux pump